MYAKSVQGFLSYDWTNKQRNRQTEMATLYVEVVVYIVPCKADGDCPEKNKCLHGRYCDINCRRC